MDSVEIRRDRARSEREKAKAQVSCCWGPLAKNRMVLPDGPSVHAEDAAAGGAVDHLRVGGSALGRAAVDRLGQACIDPVGEFELHERVEVPVGQHDGAEDVVATGVGRGDAGDEVHRGWVVVDPEILVRPADGLDDVAELRGVIVAQPVL